MDQKTRDIDRSVLGDHGIRCANKLIDYAMMIVGPLTINETASLDDHLQEWIDTLFQNREINEEGD
jgi:hypothetical protein